MKKLIIAMILLVAGYLAGFIQKENARDYIVLSRAYGKLMVGGEGLYSDSAEPVRIDGKKAKTLMQAIEIYESRGYELVSAYGNNVGHFAVLRK